MGNYKVIFVKGCILSMLAFLLVSCSQSNDEKGDDKDITEVEMGMGEDQKPDIDRINSIFYDVSSQFDIGTLIEASNVPYYPDLMNRVPNIDMYETNAQLALNLGIYGTDLSYCLLYEQEQESMKVIGAITKLANKLCIPKEDIDAIVKSLEENINNIDSAFAKGKMLYDKSQECLKDAEREKLAALVIIGGWIEALYIATNLMDQDVRKPHIMERIASQKFALNSLIVLAYNYYDDDVVYRYLFQMRRLKAEFDKIKIMHKSLDDVQIDTANKVIHVKEAIIDIDDAKANSIKEIVASIRNYMVKV